ncbi:MAG: phosphopentomutase, partial [Clostridia bacterium]|nr:phosphopentomutase [Clostridia bacterium]
SNPTISNDDGMEKTLSIMERDFNGLCFVNLVDFDMVYGHRNDIDGYATAMSKFDSSLGELLEKLTDDDLLIITADHGCDPKTPSTDHSREYTPMLAYFKGVNPVNLGTRKCFADIGKTAMEWLQEVDDELFGNSFLKEISND